MERGGVLNYRQWCKPRLAVAGAVVLIPLLLLAGCASAGSGNPWDAPLWDFGLREMNARPSDSDQTDAELLALARSRLASLEASEAVELLDTANPQGVRVESAVPGDTGAVEEGTAFMVYVVVSQERAGSREVKLLTMTGLRPSGGGAASLGYAEREDKKWERILKGLTRSEVSEMLGEATGAPTEPDMVFEFLRGDKLRPQWLIVSFDSDRVSAVRMDLNRQ